MAGLPPPSSTSRYSNSTTSANIWNFKQDHANLLNNQQASLPEKNNRVNAVSLGLFSQPSNPFNNDLAEPAVGGARLPFFSTLCPKNNQLVNQKKVEQVLNMADKNNSLTHMSSVMGLTWRDNGSEDFSGLPLGAFLPHERRLRSMSIHQNPVEASRLDSLELLESINWGSLKISQDLDLGPAPDQNESQEQASPVEIAAPADTPKKTTPASSRFQQQQTLSRNNHHHHGRSAGKMLHIRQFNTKLNALAQKGDYAEVDRLIKLAESGEMKLDRTPNTRTYTIVVKAYCRANRIDLAEFLVKQMQNWDQSKRPNRFTFNTLMNGYVRKQNMNKASELFDHMLSFSNHAERPDQVTYSTLIKGYAAMGDMVKAEELFEKLKASANSDDNNACRPNHVTCNTMVKGYASIGAMDKAEILFNAMKRGESKLCRPDKVTYNTMIDGFAKNSQMCKAEELFNKMQSSPDVSLRPNQVTYNTMIDGYTKSGNMVMAEKIFEYLESFAENEVNNQGHSRGYYHHQPQNSDFHGGESDEESGESKPSPVTYGAMINGYVKAGQLEKAEELFEKIKRHPEPFCRPNQVSYTTMIGSYSKIGDMRKAENLFAEMLKSRNPHCRPNQVTYSILIDGYSKNGDMCSAERLLRQMKESDGSCKPNQVTYNTLIHGYAQVGDLSKAEQVFTFMKDSTETSCKPNAITYRTMIHMYRQFGKIEESKQLLESLQHEGFGNIKLDDI